MQYEKPLREFTISLEFDTSPTYGVLYRRMRAAKQEREAVLAREKQIDPVLFREIRDLENMMRLTKDAYVKNVSQFSDYVPIT